MIYDVLDDNLILDDFNKDEEELERLITLLPEVDIILNANKKKEEELMEDEIEITPILEKVSLVETKKAIYKIIRFLYEQEVEFGEF
ncbi:5486_t:CDS:2 [Funneliformis mosseae]|uniref:5486_t:CDS:1 n=1 Tax=Funneliformis mosseae TaxID=27381 RepID=A0A9N9DE89_FUNMO|nr:5486_t:CDS:2 [Funneliformis mosseae]